MRGNFNSVCKLFIIVCLFVLFSLHRIKHTEKANESNAIETLMVTDELFRFVQVPKV